MRILILNGPNLNLLGQREPDVYGNQTLGDLENQMRKFGQSQGIEVECYQSNHEGHLIDALHRARNRVSGVVFNPGGYCHTSVALRDAISAIKIPVIEVHLSNIHNREEFRTRSLTAGVCAGQISGLGFVSYEMGVLALMRLLKAQPVQAEAARPVERTSETREARELREERHEEKAREEKGREEKLREEKLREEKLREEKLREEREEREGKRRRRGRRGGRGRRRGEQEEGGTREEREAAEAAEGEAISIAERYANLKGVVVRRGLDVLAEMEEEGEEEALAPHALGLVTFHEETPEQMDVYAANQEEHESPLEVAPGAAAPVKPAPVKSAAAKPAPAAPVAEEAPEGEPTLEAVAEAEAEPVPAAEPAAEAEAQPEAALATAGLEMVATQQPEAAAEAAPAEAEGAAPEGEGEVEGEGEAEEPTTPKRGRGSRGGRRRKAPTGSRRGGTRKKTEE